ncbi:MAG: AAA family ATPase [Euryarchaeota archaeon]|nr:AAA family ATPase [Euryarchaeota archaeon]
MINPYVTGFPADPKSFAGRGKELGEIKKAIDYIVHSEPVAPQNVAIVGDWGIGKTSLLNKSKTIALDNDCFVCKITLTPEKCKDLDSFVYSTIDELHNAVWDSDMFAPKLKEKVSEWKIESLKVLGMEMRRGSAKSTPSTFFKNSLLDLWKRLQKPTIIMYDDLHYLADSYPAGLYDLRGIFQELREYDCRFMLMCTGISTLFAKIRGLSEPLMRFFEHVELRSFTLEETKEAIHLPLQRIKIDLKFDCDVIETIHTKAQGHPYFVMFFAHDVFEYKQKGIITSEFFDSIYEKIFSHLAAARFIEDLAIAGEKEKEVLFKMVGLGEEVGVKEIKAPNVSVHLKRLVEKNLVARVGRGRYKFYHPLFGEYLETVR